MPEAERELKRLCLSVCDDTGFRLYAATYDQPKRRDELITRLSSKARVEKVRITRLDIAAAAPEASLVALLRAHLQAADLPAGWRRAVVVTGIEQRLDYSSGREGVAFLHQANLLRDALPGAAPVPVVLWLSPLATSAMQKEAPDLWDWRAASFDFTGDQAPRVELLRDLITRQPGEDLGLSGKQRQARAQMLDELLAELERQGPPKSKRQANERASLLVELGRENGRLGLADEAIPRIERALDLYRGSGERLGEGQAVHLLGIIYSLDQPRRAVGHFEQWLAIVREIGDRQGEDTALSGLGEAYVNLGEPRRAIECYEQALVIAREIGDRRGEGTALRGLGRAYAILGERRRAIEHYERALVAFREIGDRQGEGTTLSGLGDTYDNLGEPRRAIECYEQALAIAREIGDQQGEGLALSSLGLTYLTLGEPRRANEHFEQHVSIAREIGNRRGEGLSLYCSALAFDKLGDRAGALTRMELACRIYEQIEHPWREKARARLAEWQGEDISGKSQRSSDAVPRGE